MAHEKELKPENLSHSPVIGKLRQFSLVHNSKLSMWRDMFSRLVGDPDSKNFQPVHAPDVKPEAAKPAATAPATPPAAPATGSAPAATPAAPAKP